MGYVDVICYLITAVANINMQTNTGMLFLMMACYLNLTEWKFTIDQFFISHLKVELTSQTIIFYAAETF